ncbi:MAG: hypothetical protein H0X39_10670 [Actinobacteria bacterium]|nr:hypothetical protein [Actinomycetota bacterium]
MSWSGSTVDSSEEREERLAYNEAIFRSLNERIASLEIDFGRNALHDFICECSTPDCFERITLTRVEYELVRNDGTHFLLAHGHEDIEIEQTVTLSKNYIVVAKDGPAGIIALNEDPRA